MKNIFAVLLLLFCLACQTEEGVSRFSLRTTEADPFQQKQFALITEYRLSEYIGGTDYYRFKQGKANSFEVELMGHLSKTDVQFLCLSKGDLMFAETIAALECQKILFALDSLFGGDSLILDKPSTDTLVSIPILNTTAQLLEENSLPPEDSIRRAWAIYQKPLSTLISIIKTEDYRYPFNPLIGTAAVRDTAEINRLFRAAIQIGWLTGVRFAWAAESSINDEFVMLYCIRYTIKDDNFTGISGIYTDNVQVYSASNDESKMEVFFDETGASLWEDMTRAQIGRYIGIMMDGKVWSMPRVNETIKNGISLIQLRDMPLRQLLQFASIVNAGPLMQKGTIVDYHYDSTAVWKN